MIKKQKKASLAYINDYMNNRDKLLNSQHQTIELDEDMLKSYDEKSQ